MFLTGRFALLIGSGIIPVVVISSTTGTAAWAVVGGWLLLALVLLAVDVVVAASARAVAVTHWLPTIRSSWGSNESGSS